MRKELREVLEELGYWWDSFAEDTRKVFITILASLPGGDDLYSAFGPAVSINLPALGWKETDILARLLSSIEDANDVHIITQCILHNSWPTEDKERVQNAQA